MNKHTIFGLALFFYMFVSLGTYAQMRYYVANNGNDKNPGTQEQPFLSLKGARDAIRQYKKTQVLNASIEVIIKGGIYEMNAPFILGPEDSGTAAHPISYQAEPGSRPVFSGGRELKGFKRNKDGLWELKIPKHILKNRQFEQLYVNGKRSQMASTPNEGFLEIDDIAEQIVERGAGRVPLKAKQVLSFTKENFKNLIKIEDREIDDLRFRAYHKWDFTLRKIDSIDRRNFKIYTSGKGMKPWNPIKKGGRIVFENYRAALDQEGEWYLNDDGVLYYKPLTGETINEARIIAPRLENLISVEGNAVDGQFVQHVQFKGLSFVYCSYVFPETGSEPNQAAALINAAVQLEGARNIDFLNCEISKTGQHALWFGKGCKDNRVKNCFLNDLGGGGIYLGDFSPKKNAEHTSHTILENNIIQTGGQEFPSAVGIWVGHSSDNTISHNDIGNFYYTGISVGWIWGYAESHAKRNKIIFNRIHHIGWALLSDMAAVYTLGKSEGTVISNNWIHDIHAYSYGGWGLYPDEGSSHITMENNLVYNTKTGGFHQHYGENNIIKNNIFAFAKLYQAQCTRVEEHKSFTFERNIIVFNEGMVLKGAWNDINIQMDHNLYWNTKNKGYDFNNGSFEVWKKTGHDTNSIIGDPGFKNLQQLDFKIQNKENVQRIGFVPFDPTLAGVKGEKEWKEKARLPLEIKQKFDKVVAENLKMNTGRN